MPKGTNFQKVTEFQELLCLFLVPLIASHMHVHQEVFEKNFAYDPPSIGSWCIKHADLSFSR